MKRKNRYTEGFEDIERTFDVLDEQQKKEARARWLEEHQAKTKRPTINAEEKGGDIK